MKKAAYASFQELEYSGSSWYNRVISVISNLEASPGKNHRSIQIDTLRRIARRLDEFSSSCGQCEQSMADFERLLKIADTHQQTGDKETIKEYSELLETLRSHLTKEHKLIEKGHYVGIAMTVGTGLGGGLIAITSNAAFMAVGIGAGLAVGYFLDARAKKDGRVL